MHQHIKKLTNNRGAGALLVLIIVFVLIVLMIINRYMNALTVTTRGIATQALVPGSYYSAYALLSDRLWHYRWGQNPPAPGSSNFTYGEATIGINIQQDGDDFTIQSSSNLRSTTRALEAQISGTPDYYPVHIVLALDSSGSGHEKSRDDAGGDSCILENGCPPCLYETTAGGSWYKPITGPSNPNLCEPLNSNRAAFETKFLNILVPTVNPDLKITAVVYADQASYLSQINYGTETRFDTVQPVDGNGRFDSLFQQLSYMYPSGYTNIEDAIEKSQTILTNEPVTAPESRKLIIIGTDLGLMTKANGAGMEVYDSSFNIIPGRLNAIEAQTTARAEDARLNNICIIAYTAVPQSDWTVIENNTATYLIDNVLSVSDSNAPEWCQAFQGLYIPSSAEDPDEALGLIAEDINQLNLTIHEIDPLPTP